MLKINNSLDSIDEVMKKVIKEQVKNEVSKITLKIEKLVNEQLEYEVLVRSSKEAKTSHVVQNSKAAYKALVDALKADQNLLDTLWQISHIKDLETEQVMIKNPPLEQTGGPKEEGHEKNLNLPETMQSTDVFEAPAHQEFETGVHDKQAEEEVHHLPDWFQQPKRLPSPDHAWNKPVPAVLESVQPWLSNLARRQDPRESFDELTDTTFDFSAFSLTELEYFCEEVYKATTKKLDWINPEGRQYPHDLRNPLPLVTNSEGCHVIPFHHFINNDLEYLHGDRRPSAQLNVESSNSQLRQIRSSRNLTLGAVCEDNFCILRPQGNQLVTDDGTFCTSFKRRDFKDFGFLALKDMLLLLVQGKLTNLNVEERIAFNVSLRMFTRSVVIQRRVEDLQLGVESYQKKLNLTKPDTYRSNLRRRDAYTPYSDPRGFIYENKDKKNRLMRIDELHKFSDGTLDDVQTALNDRLKGIKNWCNLPRLFEPTGQK
ncbi:hypothetical protein Tco_0424999 [Tanacetum coccineum]